MGSTKNSKVNFEKVISLLNDSLVTSEKELYIPSPEDQTTIHVIGAPRSGTTLLTQLLISYLQVGYISNLTAVFFKNPVYGIHLSNKLLSQDYSSNFNSNFGRTNRISEPHEFSYFWKMHLNYPDFFQRTYIQDHKINWNNLKEILYQMVLAYNRPIVFKSFQYGFHAQDAVNLMPKTIFLLIERDIYQNAYSILKLRKKQKGNEETWASIKPVQYEILKSHNKFTQVMGQVLFLNMEYKKQLSNIPIENKLVIRYSDLCSNTDTIISDIKSKIDIHSIVKNSSNQLIEFRETKKKIPNEILSELIKAESWLKENYPELKKYEF